MKNLPVVSHLMRVGALGLIVGLSPLIGCTSNELDAASQDNALKGGTPAGGKDKTKSNNGQHNGHADANAADGGVSHGDGNDHGNGKGHTAGAGGHGHGNSDQAHAAGHGDRDDSVDEGQAAGAGGHGDSDESTDEK
jgi:hypothetical protein